MKLSIITPTHDTKYLKELHDSIQANSYQEWEWIILLNNGAKIEFADERVRVITSKQKTTSVGALKKEACIYATGEAIVEVDHDDMLTPDSLFKIASAFADENIGFVYSDNARLEKNFIPFNAKHGWTHKKFIWKGKELISMNSQPLTPSRLGHIWFAPDHVRAWRTSVYNSIGGHNESLEVCDDLDLMHRLYMVTVFKHIPEVLYIYRVTGNNTWLKKNKLVQQKSQEIYHANIEALANRFCQFFQLPKIDLCGAFSKPEGYLSIDLQDADIIADLNNGIPLPDNSVGVIRAYDALEHLPNQQLSMKEIHRVLVPGGLLLSMTPSTDGRGAWQDPSHVSFWNENSFWYWTQPEQMQYIRNKNVRFFASSLRTIFRNDWHKQHNISHVEAFLEKI